MKHGLILLLGALALFALCLILWDAYTEVTGHPLLGALAPLIFFISVMLFLFASVSLALLLSQGRRRARRRRHSVAPYFRQRRQKALPPEWLRSGYNNDPRAWDENENLPRGNEL